MGEERSGMPFGSQTELDQVEAGYAIGAKNAPHFNDIGLGSRVMVGPIRVHAVYLVLSNWHLTEKRFLRHTKIALRVIYRDATLIAPEDFHQRPVNLAAIRFIGEQTIQLSRR